MQAYMGKDGNIQYYDLLTKAADAYLTDSSDVMTVADYLDEIDVAKQEDEIEISESYEKLYNTLLALIGPTLGDAYYDMAYEAYQRVDYDVAIPNFEKAFRYDASNGDALYYLADAYKSVGRTEDAREAYRQVIELFPGTLKASKSTTYLEELESAAQ